MLIKKQFSAIAIAALALGSLAGCDSFGSGNVEEGGFLVGIEAATGTDVLVTTDNLMEGVISPVGQGVEQPAWMTFFTAGEYLMLHGYAADNQLTSYTLDDGALITRGPLVTELGLYASCDVDDNTMLVIGLPRAGYEDRVIYTIDKSSMTITKRTATRIDERQDEGLVAWPTDMVVRDGKLFISYYLNGSGEKEDVPSFSTPNSNQARVAVYSYPDMVFEKIITDDRTSDIGVYLGPTALEETEDGTIYSYSTSSLASGFAPTPTNPSGFLRIPAGSTDFDDSYFFNFEQVTGGSKINNAVYAGDGKMVVRLVKADTALWGTYNPVPENPSCVIAIADLNTQTVTEVTDVPLHGGEWGMAHLVHKGKVYINVSTAEEAHIYEIDPATATATQGARIEGNWVKGIFTRYHD